MSGMWWLGPRGRSPAAKKEPAARPPALHQYGVLPTDGMRAGDYSGLVNTPSGWLPQSVVNQFQGTSPGAVSANDSVIYDQYNVVNGNQFTPITLATGQTFAPFPGNAIPKSMLDTSAQKALQYIVPAGPYYLNSNGLISNIVTPRVVTQDERRYTVRGRPDHRREEPPHRPLHGHADRQDSGHTDQPDHQRSRV